METITIPSPSAFLSSPVVSSAQPPSADPSPQKRKMASTKQAAGASKTPAGAAKPKQSKSRNGCITCKAKRLKCDETKPSCQQCHKRSVTCGGYKKDFKWRPFEEATFTSKAAPPRIKRSILTHAKSRDPGPSESPSDTSSDRIADLEIDTSMHESFYRPTSHFSSTLQTPDTAYSDHDFSPIVPFNTNASPYLRDRPLARSFEPNSVTSPLDSLFDDNSHMPSSTSRPSYSGQSPTLIDLLQPGSELNARPQHHVQVQNPPMDMPYPFQNNLIPDHLIDDDVEEIVRRPHLNSVDPWVPLSTARICSEISSRSDSPASLRGDPYNRLFRQPEVQAGSPEMLMLRFDKQTCGILSVKDGPTENPWRTLIWPLARDSPALYHAIASLTAFHTSKEKPALRVDGMEHMRRSIRSLATGIEKMRTDTALATTLVLAFSESWDQHISTGIEHLRGARILVNQAVAKHSRRAVSGDDLSRLKFLCNTWVYMDVIARLTSIDDEEPTDFDSLLAPLQGSFGNQSNEIDPLMGCATTLFPLIGQAATLCRKVRSLKTNSIVVISQANNLKEQIEQWQVGTDFESPEDPSAEVQHALKTAEAYRFATLLYLHQAVPEIPSLSSAQLAKKVLVFLATVPLSSRLVIVQIYPLLAAGCEAVDAEDRVWVEDRWKAMSYRMWIGNIDKCWVVTKEVWDRRDAAERERGERERESRVLMMRRQGAMGFSSESSKRKWEEEVERERDGEGGFSFEEMLNGPVQPQPHQQQQQQGQGQQGNKRNRTSFSGGSSGANTWMQGQPQQQPPRRRLSELITEDLDPELTVRGGLHWVGVMKEWGWEVLLG